MTADKEVRDLWLFHPAVRVDSLVQFGAMALIEEKELILRYSKGMMIIDIRYGQKSGFLLYKKHILFQSNSLKNL